VVKCVVQPCYAPITTLLFYILQAHPYLKK
jgi:hypothetical protein